jgi:signal transduction histidine kinase
MDILIKGGLDEGEESDILERAGREVGRINEILKEFLDFARPPKEFPGPVMVNAVVTDAVAVVTGSPEGSVEGVEIELGLQDALPPAIIDEGKLRQVFVNLIMNAVHAVSDKGGGKVVVTSGVSNRKASGRRAMDGPRRKDDPDFLGSYDRKGTSRFVEVVVSDTGPGIDPADLDRIFEPFYTTKSERAGTGLGLFVSRGIVQTNGGMIEVSSTPGEGTTFKVILPAGRDEDTGS